MSTASLRKSLVAGLAALTFLVGGLFQSAKAQTIFAGENPVTVAGSHDGWHHLSFVDEQRPFDFSSCDCGEGELKSFTFVAQAAADGSSARGLGSFAHRHDRGRRRAVPLHHAARRAREGPGLRGPRAPDRGAATRMVRTHRRLDPRAPERPRDVGRGTRRSPAGRRRRGEHAVCGGEHRPTTPDRTGPHGHEPGDRQRGSGRSADSLCCS